MIGGGYWNQIKTGNAMHTRNSLIASTHHGVTPGAISLFLQPSTGRHKGMALLVATVGDQDIQFIIPPEWQQRLIPPDTDVRTKWHSMIAGKNATACLPRRLFPVVRGLAETWIGNGKLRLYQGDYSNLEEIKREDTDRLLDSGQMHQMLLAGPPQIALKILLPVLEKAKASLKEEVRVWILGTNRVGLAQQLKDQIASSAGGFPKILGQILDGEPSFASALAAACLRVCDVEAEHFDLGSDPEFNSWVAHAPDPEVQSERLDIVRYDEPVFGFANRVAESALIRTEKQEQIVLHISAGMANMQRALLLAFLARIPVHRLMLATHSDMKGPAFSAFAYWQRFHEAVSALQTRHQDFAVAWKGLQGIKADLLFNDVHKRELCEDLRSITKLWAELLSGNTQIPKKDRRLPTHLSEVIKKDLQIALRPPDKKHPHGSPFLVPGFPILGMAVRAVHGARQREARETGFALVTVKELAQKALLWRIRSHWVSWDTTKEVFVILSQKIDHDQSEMGKTIKAAAHWPEGGRHFDQLAAKLLANWPARSLTASNGWADAIRTYEKNIRDVERCRNWDLHDGRPIRWSDIEQHVGNATKVHQLLRNLLVGLDFTHDEIELLGAPERVAEVVRKGLEQLLKETDVV